MIKFEIFNEYGKEFEEIDTIKELVEFAIKYKKLDNIEFNVILVGNDYIHELNRDYRGIDRPTDVITFALEDGENVDRKNWRMLGDIYISIDKVVEQSKEYGHSFLRELAFLTIHGFLHLLGYDHMTEDDEKIMFKEQEVILNEFGIKRWDKKKRF